MRPIRFQDYIRFERLARGLSQGQLAKEIGATAQLISNAERGLSTMSTAKLARLAIVLELNHDRFVETLCNRVQEKADAKKEKLRKIFGGG